MKEHIVLFVFTFALTSCCGAKEVANSQPEEILEITAPESPEVQNTPEVIEVHKVEVEELPISIKPKDIVEDIEIAAIKDPMPVDGPCVFTGKSAIYFGSDDFVDDNTGHILLKNQPLAICDKTAAALDSLNRDDIFISESTYHYDGGGCC